MLWVLLVAAITLFYLYVWHTGGYWLRKNIPCIAGFEFYAHLWKTITMKEAFGTQIDKLYKRFRDAPYFGAFAFFKPGLVLVDPEMVKTVLMTEFSSFEQNDFDVDENLEPLFATNPFVLTGTKWKRSRTQISPAFTSGRMKAMFPLMLEVGQKMTKFIDGNKDSSSSKGLDAKELSEMFAMDNVATCAFGIDAESFTNANSDFIRMARKIFEPTTTNTIKLSITLMAPWLTKILRTRFVPKETTDWMEAVINQNVKYREEHNISRDDFLQGMMNMRQKTHSEFQAISNFEMTGHSLSFMTDGYETSSGVLAFALYTIASNEDAQKNLRQEIRETLDKYDGNITYEAIMQMSYLDRIIFETLRMYPPLLVMQKRCTQECTLLGSAYGGKDITMKPGETVLIPVYSIHRDPEYYPDPDRFDPDRFTDEEKSSRHAYAFLGFGGGPRLCLGMRFALLQMKVALLYAVKSYKLSVSPKTIEPIRLDRKSFLYRAEGGLWINFNKL